jgi:adenylylsulfate kinase
MPGFTIWLTGLPCAGKSTIARTLARPLLESGWPVEVLDGDIVRRELGKGLGFSRADRDANVRRIAFVANLLARNGVAVIVAVVSPYRQAREEARKLLGRVVEVHVDCPVLECERRDVKGMYKQARAGTLTGFTGVDDPYEAPQDPELTLDTSAMSVDHAVTRILDRLNELGYQIPGTTGGVDVAKRYAELGVWPEPARDS